MILSYACQLLYLVVLGSKLVSSNRGWVQPVEIRSLCYQLWNGILGWATHDSCGETTDLYEKVPITYLF